MKHKVVKQPGAYVHRWGPDNSAAELIQTTKLIAHNKIIAIAPEWKQRSAAFDLLMGIETDIPARIKAIRDASNQLEILIGQMSDSELDICCPASWAGWPE